MRKTRKAYTLQFKQDAIALAAALGSDRLAADELNLHPVLIWRWRVLQKEGHLRATSGADKAIAAPKKSRKSKYPLSFRDEAGRRWRAGENVKHIASSLGIHNPKLIYTWATRAPENGTIPPRHSQTAASAPVATGAPASALRYCPCCGFRIDTLIKAVNAMSALNAQNHHA